MPQNEYIEEAIKAEGRRMDYVERKRKREAREPHLRGMKARNTIGLKAKLLNRKNRVEKVEIRKKSRQESVQEGKRRMEGDMGGAVPTYLMERGIEQRAKILCNMVKEKRKEKAGKWDVPLARVKGISEEEIFKVVTTGKRNKKAWKRMITKATFVGEGFTRKPPKFERFIRPMALRQKKANVTHPELKATFQLAIIGVKKNPQSPVYTQLGVLTKGTIVEVNVSELGLVTSAGRVVWGKYAQITNHPENDGCVNAVLLV
ncbi:unnamed protein product [Sphagnum compactum]